MYHAIDLSQPAWLPAQGRNDDTDSAIITSNQLAPGTSTPS